MEVIDYAVVFYAANLMVINKIDSCALTLTLNKQKKSFTGVLENSIFENYGNIHRKSPTMKSFCLVKLLD